MLPLSLDYPFYPLSWTFSEVRTLVYTDHLLYGYILVIMTVRSEQCYLLYMHVFSSIQLLSFPFLSFPFLSFPFDIRVFTVIHLCPLAGRSDSRNPKLRYLQDPSPSIHHDLHYHWWLTIIHSSALSPGALLPFGSLDPISRASFTWEIQNNGGEVDALMAPRRGP